MHTFTVDLMNHTHMYNEESERCTLVVEIACIHIRINIRIHFGAGTCGIDFTYMRDERDATTAEFFVRLKATAV